MIDIVPNNKCTGCSACNDICPKNAISMVYDLEGFRYPVIDYSSCVECGLCDKVCPALEQDSIYNPYIFTFAGYSQDKSLLMSTTSGGFATQLSEIFIKQGGVVAGVKYSDDFINAEYVLVDSHEDLNELKNSKYVQSEKNGIFIKIKNALKEGHKVLFTGCPCDISGLLNFLRNTDVSNLTTCELVCMGVTSPKIAEDYAVHLQKKFKSPISYLCARSKINGWFVPTLEIKFQSGKKLIEPLFGSYYGRGFQIYNRPSCFHCKYRGTNGKGDIRIGDFWGIKKSDEFWNKNGVSCIFVRTQKGMDAIEIMRNNNFKFYEVDYKTATDNNMSSYKNKGEYYENLRNKFKEIFLEKGLIVACKETADLGFKMKRIIPASLQPVIKSIYHKLRDK